MQIIPAIDLLNGLCVRLLHGDYDKVTHYAVDPVEQAALYRSQGASWIHIVDLDGARGDSSENLKVIERIAAIDGLQVQSGGGVRDDAGLQQRFDAGVARAVTGSLAIREPEKVSAWMTEYGSSRFALAMDIRLDEDEVPRVATHGWLEQTDISLWDALRRLTAKVEHVLCTDIARDGAMTGPNLSLYAECVKRLPEIAFQASGGLRHAGDADELAKLGLSGAITGKALLENEMSLEELSRFLQNV